MKEKIQRNNCKKEEKETRKELKLQEPRKKNGGNTRVPGITPVKRRKVQT